MKSWPHHSITGDEVINKDLPNTFPHPKAMDNLDLPQPEP